MDYQTLELDVKQGIATLRLNRPDAANALNMQMGRELMDAATRCDADPGVRAVLLTASGERFCAGGDLAEFAARGEDLVAALKELTGHLHVAVSRLLRMDAPVVAAVQGVAAGAGMSLALGADLVLASDKARFTMAYTRAGLVPDGCSTYLLPRLVGLRRAQALMLENPLLDAHEAQAWGLVTRVVPHDELAARAQALAEELAAGPTRSFGATKRLLLSSFDTPPETQMELESRAISEAAAGHDAREGIQAFMAKRAPRFEGR